jgi:biopolymer transport protein ExbD
VKILVALISLLLAFNSKVSAEGSASATIGHVVPLVILITDDSLVFQAQEVSDFNLIPTLLDAASQRKSETVFLRPEPEVTFDRVTQVLEALKAAGFANIAIVTDSVSPTSFSPENSMQAAEGEPPPKVAAPDSQIRPKQRPTETLGKGYGQDSGNALKHPPSISKENDFVRVAINSCWNIGSLSSAAQRVTLVMRFEVNEDGTPVAPSIQMTNFEGGDGAAVQQVFEAAKRAIVRGARGCGGYDGYQSMFAKGNAPVVLRIYFDAFGGAMLD